MNADPTFQIDSKDAGILPDLRAVAHVFSMKAFLPETITDSMVLFLRGHLLMEAGIDGAIKIKLAKANKIDNGMTFFKKISWLDGLYSDKITNGLVDALIAYNEIRNKLAHELILDISKMEDKWTRLITACNVIDNNFKETRLHIADLRKIISIICMRLDVIGGGIGGLLMDEKASNKSVHPTP